MGNKKNTSISNIIIIITIIMFVIIVLVIAFYFFSQFKKVGEENNKIRDNAEKSNLQDVDYDYNSVPEGVINIIGNNVSTLDSNVKFSSAKQQIKCYSIKIVKEKGREKEYQLDSDYKAKLKITDSDSNSIEININNSETIKDGLYNSDFKTDANPSFTFNFYKVGEYLVFTNHNSVDYRNIRLYIVDKNGKIEELYDLDSKNKGMIIESVEFIDNSIIIQATRKSNGGVITYNGKPSSDKSIVNSIPQNTPVDATYTYSIDNKGSISFTNPEIKIKSTYKDFLNETMCGSKNSN